MANVIEQIVQPKNFGSQTIEMTVRSNERGPQGEQGEQGEAATITAGDVYSIGYGQTPQVLNRGTSGDAILDFYLPEGKPGAVHYTAGPGISITEDNVIEATGGMAVYWGNIKGTLSNQTDLNNAINAKQNKLTAGTNITISGDTISSKNYTAGSGLNLNGGEFSVDTDTIQTKLTAGTNVQINAGTISATDTTYNNFIGADGGSGGSAGLVPAPVATDNVKMLQGNGTWSSIGSSNISSNAVTTAKINNSAVTTAKINDGAVTTDKIGNKAVTGSKIDFSSMLASSSNTFPTTSKTWQFGSNAELTLYRVGNIVHVSESAVVSSVSATGDYYPVAYTIPSGYRPVDAGAILGKCVAGQYSSEQHVDYFVQPDGSVNGSVGVTISAATRINFQGFWITNDDWPTS